MEQIEPLLRELAAQLGTTVQYLWQVLINQAQVYVIIYLSRFFYLFVSSIGLFWCIKTIKKSWDNSDELGDNFVAFLFVATLVTLVLTIVLIFSQMATYNNFVTAIFNPEYWALQQILEFIK